MSDGKRGAGAHTGFANRRIAMQISQLVERLRSIERQHGDMPVRVRLAVRGMRGGLLADADAIVGASPKRDPSRDSRRGRPVCIVQPS